MSQKQVQKAKLKSTLDELDSAVGQWNSITNKPDREQASDQKNIQEAPNEKAKKLLEKLRSQLDDFALE